MLWRAEFRKHLPLFGVAYAVTVATGIAVIVRPDVLAFEVIQALGGMLCWSATVVYSAAVVFRYLALGADPLLHLGTIGRWRIALMKVAVLGALLFSQHLIAVAMLLGTLLDTAGGDVGPVMTYLVVAKALSIVTFLTAVGFLSTASKVMRGRAWTTTTFTLALLAVVVAQGILLWRTGAAATQDFFIGVGGDFFTVNLYANILPITLTGPEAGFLPPVAWLSASLNLGATVVFAVLWAAVATGRRHDFLPL
jgi:hypothetical protein